MRNGPTRNAVDGLIGPNGSDVLVVFEFLPPKGITRAP